MSSRDDELDNEVLVLGAVSMALHHPAIELIIPETWTDSAYIDIRLPFMLSTYRISVLMLPNTEEER